MSRSRCCLLVDRTGEYRISCRITERDVQCRGHSGHRRGIENERTRISGGALGITAVVEPSSVAHRRAPADSAETTAPQESRHSACTPCATTLARISRNDRQHREDRIQGSRAPRLDEQLQGCRRSSSAVASRRQWPDSAIHPRLGTEAFNDLNLLIDAGKIRRTPVPDRRQSSRRRDDAGCR